MPLTITSASVPQAANTSLPAPVQQAYKALLQHRAGSPADELAVIDAAILRLLQPWIKTAIYLSVTEASAYWGISRTHVKRLVQEGHIPGAFKVGRDWTIPAWWKYMPRKVGHPTKREQMSR